MYSTPLLDLFRIVYATAILIYASYSDLKTRKVGNPVWLLLGITGIGLLWIQFYLFSLDFIYYLIPIPTLILFLYLLCSEGLINPKTNKIDWRWLIIVCLGIALFIYTTIVLYQDRIFIELLIMPIFIFIVLGMYEFGLIHGGADAKALMGLILLLPAYPQYIPSELIFYRSILVNEFTLLKYELILKLLPFPLIVLFNAVLLFIVIPLFFALYNIYKREFELPQALFGFKLSIEHVPQKFVWLMEKLQEGKRVIVLFPSRLSIDTQEQLETELRKFRAVGIKKVWVTPKFPFMVPLAIGFWITIMLGFPPLMLLI